ncbi:MAG: hypothetical protein Q8L48_07990 [Archangium sp.]|nr:hypothetical protein [Archangium sp.]
MRQLLLLDLVAQRDGFLTDDGMNRLAAQLEGPGVSVRVLRAVGVSPGDAAVMAGLASGPPPELVVMARAWSEALIDWVRTLIAPDARLVRLSRDGTPSALDGRFDAVLDVAGVMAVLRGEDPQPARFRPAITADLRRRLEEQSEVPATSAGDGMRATISGPASGCPWMADARKNPVFEGLGGEGIQFKGCTFCLDQSGAYAAPTEAQALASWLSQVRAIRARSPQAREVLLIDERPHPFLPAFFEAVAAEPALHGLELLIKSRVDWLLQFGESHLAPAATAAAKSGSVVHVYLVGFENFDQFHLDLFNKGQTAEEAEAAITLLRSLGDRFPRSFEFRRLRAHGIVLFTPWTTPGALLENARWMAKVNFSELRAEALKTRLRLYPRTPLYHLAERDGLLTERFEAARPDRAAEQGYDASAPWRFRDARTEAVYRVASALSATRAQAEADVLRCAATLLIEHPGLAEVPDDAHLPVMFSTQWRGLPRLQGLGAFGLDLELLGVLRGQKAASLKENVPAAVAPGLVRAYRAMGLHADVTSTHTCDVRAGVHREGGEHAIVAVAATADALGQVLALQRSLTRARGRADVEALGKLMGYPACCSAAFADQLERGDNADNERQTLLRFPEVALSPLLNRFGPFPLVSHHVCGPHCEPSLAMAAHALELVRERSPEAARRVEQAQGQPVLFLDYRRIVDLEGRFEGDDFVIDQLDVAGARVLSMPAVGELAPRGVNAGGARLYLSPDGVRVQLAGGAGHFVAATRPVLLVPGAPLAAVVRRAMGELAPRGESGELAPRGAAALPALPKVIRPTVRVQQYRIARVDREADAWSLVLSREGDEFGVRLSARVPGEEGPAAGPFRFDFGPLSALTEERRLALNLLARVISDASAR